MNTFKRELIQSLKTLALALVLSVGVSYVSAWTGPTAAAPGGNASVPLNVSATAQTKTGGINFSNYAHFTGYGTDSWFPYTNGANYLRGPLYFNSVLYDENNTGYYLDPAGTSRMNYTVNDNSYNYGWTQADVYYDRYNNGYYLQPRGTNRLNYVVADNTYTYGNQDASDFYVRAVGRWASAPNVSRNCYDGSPYSDGNCVYTPTYCKICVNNSCSEPFETTRRTNYCNPEGAI